MTTSSSHYPSMAEVNAQLAAQERRREIARMGALAMHAKHDAKAVAARTLEGRMRSYRERVDPTGELAKRDPQELARRAECLLKLDMARVRYAKRERDAERARLHDMVRRTPSDDMPMLGAELIALEMNARALARLATDEHSLDAMKGEVNPGEIQNEAAPVSAEAAPSPQFSAKHPKIVSSDGGALSVAPMRRRRQTSTPSGSSATPQKATKNNDSTSKRQPRRS